MNARRLIRIAFIFTLMLTTGLCLLSSCRPRGGDKPAAGDTEPPEAPATDGTPDTEPSATEAQTLPDTQPESLPDTRPAEDPTCNVFPTEGKNVEVGIFWEPPLVLDTVENYDPEEQYDRLRDAHVTFIEMTNPNAHPDLASEQRILEMARERGIKISWLPGPDGANLLTMSPDKLQAYLETLAADDNIVGIHVVDEPTSPWAFASVCAAATRAGLTPRLNFLPYFATWVFENYQGHIEDTIAAVGKESFGYLSYDQYPFPYDGSAPNDLYYNLNLIREIGLKYGVDTAFYIQSIGEHGNFRRTTGDEIRFHVNAGLAYGIKSYTYFTWWTTGYCDPADYGIISPYGEKTDTYDAVADVNAKALTVGPLLRRLDAVEVYHVAGRENGVTNYKQSGAPIYPVNKSRLIVSFMEDRETHRNYVMLVNKNTKKSVTDTFTVSDAITHVYNCSEGRYDEIDVVGGSFELTFEPGGFVLLALGQHDCIVTRQPDADENNLALGKPVAVSGVNPGNGWYAYCLTDGRRNSAAPKTKGWRSPSDAAWFEVDLGRVTTVARVDLYPAGNAYNLGRSFPRSYTVEVSTDRENWTVVAQVNDSVSAWTAIPTFTFAPVGARYVRVNVTKGAGSGSFEVAEMEIYSRADAVPAPDNSVYKPVGGEPAGTNVALGRPTACSSQVSGWDPEHAVDGTSSGWSSDIRRNYSPNAAEWISVDLVTEYTLDHLILKPRTDDVYFPEKLNVQVSDDGVSWRTVYTLTCTEKVKGDREVRIDLEDGVTARFVRLYSVKLTDMPGFNDGYLFQLNEMEVYNR